jgi:hypothetical protein
MAHFADSALPPHETPSDLVTELAHHFKKESTCVNLANALSQKDVDRLGDLALLTDPQLSKLLVSLTIADDPVTDIVIQKLTAAVVPLRKPKSFATIAAAPPSAGGGSARPPVMRPADGSVPVKPSGKAASWTWFKNNLADKMGRPLSQSCSASARGPSFVAKVFSDNSVTPVTFPVTFGDSAEIDRFHVRVSLTEEITTLLVPLMGQADYDEWAVEAKITKPRT